jgi:hypothetical protein
VSVPIEAEASSGFLRSEFTPKHVCFPFRIPILAEAFPVHHLMVVKLRGASVSTGLLYEASTLTKAWGKPANVRIGGGFVSHPRLPLVLPSKEDRSAWAAAFGFRFVKNLPPWPRTICVTQSESGKAESACG